MMSESGGVVIERDGEGGGEGEGERGGGGGIRN